MDLINAKALVSSVIFTIVGLFSLGIAFVIWDKLTPGDLWQEVIEKKNMPLAIIMSSVALGISLIVAAAIHG